MPSVFCVAASASALRRRALSQLGWASAGWRWRSEPGCRRASARRDRIGRLGADGDGRPGGRATSSTAACSAASRISRRRRSASSTCSWPAGRRSIGPVRLQAAAQRSATARSCRTRCARASGSPACRATSRRSRSPARISSSRSTASPAPGSASCCRTPPTIADDLCFVRSMHTEAINHDPAITFFQTGSQIAGRPEHRRLARLRPRQRRTRTCRPSSCSITQGQGRPAALRAPLGQRLPALAASGRAVPRRQGPGALSRAIPPASTREQPPRAARPPRATCNRTPPKRPATPRSTTRIAQYEMAFRMQTSVPERDRPLEASRQPIFELYGPDATHARHLRRQLPARPAPRRARRAVHPALPPGLGPARQPAAATSAASARRPTRPAPALVTDLKQRGLLDDTLVVWGGEFGRTGYSPGQADRRTTTAATTIRAASPSGWPAAASSRASSTARPTTSATTSPRIRVHVHDLHATHAAPAGHRPRAADLRSTRAATSA